LGERSSPVETPPVKKNGWLERERERVCVCLSPVKYGRERERCWPVEMEPGEEGRPTGREVGVPKRERERESQRRN